MKQWPTLYSKTAAGNINYWKIWTQGFVVQMEWGKVGTDKPITDYYEAEGKNTGRSNETTPEEQAEKEAQAKFDKQLRLKYFHSIKEAGHSLNIKPMRAYTLDAKREKKLEFPVDVQPKYNGVRCMAYNLPDGSVRLMSRGGKDYTLPHLQQELQKEIPKGWCLDGELYVHGMNLQTIRHHIETYSEESLQVLFTCYDITQLPPGSADWTMRLVRLTHWFETHQNLRYTVMALTQQASSMRDIEALHNLWVAEGYEGLMVRTRTGEYKLGARSTQLLKYKKFFDDEFEVIDHSVGRDGVLVLRCLQEDGLPFDVRPMGTEKERAQMLADAQKYVGRKFTVRYQERSSDNIPMYPVGVGFRSAKDMD